MNSIGIGPSTSLGKRGGDRLIELVKIYNRYIEDIYSRYIEDIYSRYIVDIYIGSKGSTYVRGSMFVSV
jgi:hypothetical protein